MRRIVLVLGLLALVPMSVSACGSSGGDDGGTSGSSADPRLVAAVEASLARDIEARLRRQIRDRAFRVMDFRCRGASAQNVQCVVRATDSTGRPGNIGVAVVVDSSRGTALAQFTGTSRGRWATALNRAAARQRARNEARTQAESQR